MFRKISNEKALRAAETLSRFCGGMYCDPDCPFYVQIAGEHCRLRMTLPDKWLEEVSRCDGNS